MCLGHDTAVRQLSERALVPTVTARHHHKTRVVRRERSSPERADQISKQSLNNKDKIQNLNLYDRV